MSIEAVTGSARPVSPPAPPPKVDRDRDEQKKSDEVKSRQEDSDKASERKRSDRMVDIRA